MLLEQALRSRRTPHQGAAAVRADALVPQPLLDVHISMCEPCLRFLESYDKTRILCRQVTLEVV